MKSHRSSYLVPLTISLLLSLIPPKLPHQELSVFTEKELSPFTKEKSILKITEPHIIFTKTSELNRCQETFPSSFRISTSPIWDFRKMLKLCYYWEKQVNYSSFSQEDRDFKFVLIHLTGPMLPISKSFLHEQLPYSQIQLTHTCLMTTEHSKRSISRKWMRRKGVMFSCRRWRYSTSNTMKELAAMFLRSELRVMEPVPHLFFFFKCPLVLTTQIV